MVSWYGWSFRGESSSQSQAVHYEGEEAKLRIRVINDGLRRGTVYVRFLVADAYRLDQPIFDSDRDLTANERQSLRVVDIRAGESREVVSGFTVTSALSGRPFDVRCQIWNPHRLFNGPRPRLFYDSGWKGAFQVVAKPTNEFKRLTVFVSYSHDTPEHEEWVKRLVEGLRMHE